MAAAVTGADIPAPGSAAADTEVITSTNAAGDVIVSTIGGSAYTVYPIAYFSSLTTIPAVDGTVPTKFTSKDTVTTAPTIITTSTAPSTVFPADTTTSSPASATGTTPASAEFGTTQKGSSLSSSAKIGIGLGVPLGVIIIAIAIVGFLLYRRRQHKHAKGLSNRETQLAMQQREKDAGDRFTDKPGAIDDGIINSAQQPKQEYYASPLGLGEDIQESEPPSYAGELEAHSKPYRPELP